MTFKLKEIAGQGSPNQHNVFVKEHPSKKAVIEKTLNRAHSISSYKGLLLAFLCGVLYSLAAVIVKYMKNIHPGQLSVYRLVAVFAFSLPQAFYTQENLLGPREYRFLLILRGFFGGTNIFLNFLAFRYLPLGEAVVIIYSVPVFVTIAARIFLREKCGIVQSFIVIITMIGIIFILKVPAALSGWSFNYTTEYIYGLAAAFSSLIFFTGLFIVLRKLKCVHYSIIMFNFGWMGFIESVILTAIMGNFTLATCGFQQYLLILFGIVAHTGLVLFTIAVQLEKAGPVATVRSASEIILAFLWQTFFFHEEPDGFSITGAVLLGVSIVLAGMGKWVSTLPPHSAAAKYLRFLSS